MVVRCITEGEIHKFEIIGVPATETPKLNLQRWIDAERTTLDLCYVVEEAGEFLGRIIYGFFADQPSELKIWQVHIREDISNHIDAGTALITESINLLKANGFSNVEYHYYFKDLDENDKYQEIFKNCGFRVVQEKKSFGQEEDKFKSYKQRLTFKSHEEISDDAFIDAIESVTYGTLDRDDLESLEKNGPKTAAKIYYDILKDIDFNKEWWKLAYDISGEFVGLVVSQQIGKSTGCINYIGVVPNKRGNGYVRDLIGKASSTMYGSKMENIIADIDNLNLPLENALINCGFSYVKSMTVFKMDLVG